ncbi:MAG: hypothetical protein V1839_02125 [archaeon]
MPHVDANKTLTHAGKIGRHNFVLEYLVPMRFEPVAHGAYNKKEVANYFALAKLFEEKKNVTAALDSYRIYNKLLPNYLERFSGRKVILIPGVSPDLGVERPEYVGHDIFSERFRLTTEMLRVVNELAADFKKNGVAPKTLENYLIVPASPFLFMGEFKKESGSYYLRHPFTEIFKEVNRELAESGSKQRVNENVLLEKRLGVHIDGQKGASQASDLLYDPNAAKRALIDYDRLSPDEVWFAKHEIEYCTYINRQVLASALGTVFEKLKKPICVFAKKTSYVFDILHFAKGLDFKMVGGEQGPLRNADITPFGECDPSAMRVLKGEMYVSEIKSLPQEIGSGFPV